MGGGAHDKGGGKGQRSLGLGPGAWRCHYSGTTVTRGKYRLLEVRLSSHSTQPLPFPTARHPIPKMAPNLCNLGLDACAVWQVADFGAERFQLGGPRRLELHQVAEGQGGDGEVVGGEVPARDGGEGKRGRRRGGGGNGKAKEEAMPPV